MTADNPVIPHWFSQRFLVLATWGVPSSLSRDLMAAGCPFFLGLKHPSSRALMSALWIAVCGVAAAIAGYSLGRLCVPDCRLDRSGLCSSHFCSGRKSAGDSRRPFQFSILRSNFLCLASGCIGAVPRSVSRRRERWYLGASRHALTVGFLAAMIFTIGQRVLPAFCGMRQLFSSKLMFAACLTLNLGCLLRVSSEIPAYEANFAVAWRILPVSAILELLAVSLFAVNLMVTLVLRQPHTTHR